MILDELAKQYDWILNTGVRFEEIVMCPDLINLLEYEVSNFSNVDFAGGFKTTTYFMDLKVVVSKFVSEDEVIFQNRTGEFARVKIDLGRVAVRNNFKFEVPGEYRRITLGEENES